jgi:hypothetical protein
MRAYSENYNYQEGKYWTCLREGNLSLETSKTSTVKPVSYISDTGQFISNCFFFIEGIESVKVTTMVREIFESKSSLDKILSIDHLKNQDFIASYLFKYIIQNNVCDYELIIACLDYLFCISEYLSNKLELIIDITNNKKNKTIENSISRCSYKFCNYTYFCQFNYPEKQNTNNKGCYSDHYVHNKVAQDIYFLLKYIKENLGDGSSIMIRNNQEVIKCINTIAYVIKHMYDELYSIYVSCNKKDNYEQFHKNVHK